MQAVLQTTLVPAAKAMLAHLEHVFGGDLDGAQDGLIEISWTVSAGDGRYPLSQALLFGTDQIEEAVARAVLENSKPGQNVYFGACLRHPDTPPFGRAADADAWAATCQWCDLDDEGASVAAKARYAHCPPTMVVITGLHPYARAQAFWRLSYAERDMGMLRAQNAAIGRALQGDMTVVNPSRVMRLAGSIAWPLKEGRSVVELTQLVLFDDGRPKAYAEGAVARGFPVAAPEMAPSALDQLRESVAGRSDIGIPISTGTGKSPGPAQHASNLTQALQPLIGDGRETYARNTALACLIEFIGENGAVPTPAELFELAWPQYRDRVDFRRPGRGPDELKAKCAYAIQRFVEGRIAGARTLEEAVAAFQAKRRVHDETDPPPDEAAPPGDVFETLDFDGLAALPPVSYLVDKLVTDYGFTIVYGDPAAGKTFLVLDQALHVAYGRDWHGHRVKQVGVLYIAGEGVRGLAKRILAWRHHHGLASQGAPFRVMQTGANMLDPKDVAKLLRTIDHIQPTLGFAIGMTVLDTVARTMIGDENEAGDMGRYVAGCDAVRLHTKAAAVAIHHSGKDKERGPRGSSALPAGVDTSIEILRDDNTMTVKVRKQKDDEEHEPFYMEMVKVDVPNSLNLATETSLVLRKTTDKAEGNEPEERVNMGQVKVVFDEVDRAWKAGKPWSHAPQTRDEGRYLPRWMCMKLSIRENIATAYLRDWLTNGSLSTEIRDQKTKAKGLKVMWRPDNG